MSDAAHAATQAAFAEHDAAAGGGDAAPATDERYPSTDLSSIINSAYDEAEASAISNEYRENYHSADAAEKREAERAEARGDSNLGDLQSLADRFGPYLKERGLSLPEAVERLLSTDHAIGSASPEAKTAMIATLAESYGVPTDELATMTPQAAEYAMQAHREDLVNAHHHADMAGSQARVDAFAVAKNEDGTPKHPFFAEMEPKMARIAQAAIQGDQRIAYRMQAIEAERVHLKAENAARVQRAKAAGSSITGSGAEPIAPSQSNQTVADIVAAAMAQHGA